MSPPQTGERPLGKRLRALGFGALVLVVGVVIGGAGVWALRPLPEPSPLTGPRLADTVNVTMEEYGDERGVRLVFSAGAPASLTSNAAGVVTASSCGAGEPIVSGSAPFTVDGRPLLALSLSVPLWRDLEYGDTGEDVKALQHELVRLGFLAGGTGRWDWQSRQALASAMKAVGGRLDGESMPRTAVLWLPSPEAVAKTCNARLGQQVEPGSELATFTPSVERIALQSTPQDLTPGARLVRIGRVTAPLGADGTISDPAEVAKITSMPEAAASLSSLGTDSPAPLPATLVLATTRPVASVPAAALTTTAGGACVYSSAKRAIAVDVLASSLGQSTVSFPDGSPPKTILRQSPAQSTCG